MKNIEWHIREIDRLIKENPDATIKDYFRITNGYQNGGEKIKDGIYWRAPTGIIYSKTINSR